MSAWTIVPGIIVSLIVLVVTKLWDPIAQVYGYPFDAERRVQKLVDEFSKLQDQLGELGILDPKPSSAVLSGWLQRAAGCKDKVEEIKRRHESVKSVGVQGLLPRINVVRHLCAIGRDADLELEEVKDLIAKGEGHLKEAGAAPHPIPIPIPLLPPPAAEFDNGQLAQSILDTAAAGTWGVGIQAMKPHLTSVLDFVREDGGGAPGVLGVWGMGGAGKTTLLKLARDPRVQTLDHIVLAEAGKCCDIAKLQDSIAQGTSLVLPPSLSVTNRATVLCNHLRNKKFLLLLDDLWNYIDLEAVGIPLPLGRGNQRKVVLTSRSEAVCVSMARQGVTIRMGCLDQQDAFKLFEDKVGSATINADTRIPELARQVAEMCGGLPLVLCVIGRSMCTKKNYKLWVDAVNRLEKSKVHNNLVGDDDIFNILRYSFDGLHDDEARGCFLACTLFPPFYIEKKRLIRWCMGLGFLDPANGFEGGESVIDSLQGASLLESAGSYSVDMHDIIRDMALWIVRGPGGEKWSVLNRAWVQDATIRKMNNGYWTREEWPPKDTWPELEMLAMESNRSYLDPWKVSSIGQMTNISFLELVSLDTFPMEICELHKLEYLCIKAGSMSRLPIELGKLSKLKQLHLRQSCSLGEIPTGLISQLVNLQVLDLFCSSIDYPYRPKSAAGGLYNFLGELAEARASEKLKILGICLDATRDNRAFLKQLMQKQVRIRSLCLSFINPISPGHDQPQPATSRYMIAELQPFSNDLGELAISSSDILQELVATSDGKELIQNLEHLCLENLNVLERVIWLNAARNLRRVDIKKCAKLTHATWVLQLGYLEELGIHDCPQFKRLIDHKELAENPPDHVIFPRLTYLDLSDLPELSDICVLPCEFKSSLALLVENCDKLMNISFHYPPGHDQKNIRVFCDNEWFNRLECKPNIMKSYLSQNMRFSAI